MTHQILDITRCLSRANLHHETGIDRVENAYIDFFLKEASNPFFIARVPGNYLIFDHKAMVKLKSYLDGKLIWDAPSLKFKLLSKTSSHLKPIYTTAQRLAVSNCNDYTLGSNLKRLGLNNNHYFNVGHSNIRAKLFQTMHKTGIGITVLIHDVIPLDFPQFCRDDMLSIFKKKIQIISKYSDYIIYNSKNTQARSEAWLNKFGHVPDGMVSHLGLSPLPVLNKSKPTSKRPYFVTVGTIEGRKNHQLLLDAWESMSNELPAKEMPVLHIIGKRGWKNETFFNELEQSKLKDNVIFEHNKMSDNEMWQMMQGASGLLFPSLAEGFGYPLIEAERLSIPVICSDIEVFKEVGSGKEVYLPPTDIKQWKQAIVDIKNTTSVKENLITTNWRIYTWKNHFQRIINEGRVSINK